MITVFRPIWVDDIWPCQVFQPRIERYFAIGVLQPYLELYFSAGPFQDPCDATDMAHILGVYKNVRRLTDRYFSCASRRLLGIGGREDMPSANVNANIGAARIAPLSKTERIRIQRAFLRYEIYCRLFPFDKQKGASSFSADLRFNLFLRWMKPWEVEELCSVYCYLASLARGYIVDFEDQFVEAFLLCPGVQPLPPLSPPLPPTTLPEKRTRIQSLIVGFLKVRYYSPPFFCLTPSFFNYNYFFFDSSWTDKSG